MDDPSRAATDARKPLAYRQALERIAHQASQLIPPPPPFRLTIGKVMVANVVLCGVFALWALQVREFHRAEQLTRQGQCAHNLYSIAVALRSYHSVYGSFPPAHIDDASGKPMHSWRVLILPFLGRSDLYNLYNFNEPWNGPGNRALLASMPQVYACPSESGPNTANGVTRYVVVTGPGTIFPDGATVSLSDLQSGGWSTVLATEAANMRVAWTEPRDLDVRTMSFNVTASQRPCISSRHAGSAGMVFADGDTHWFNETITPEDVSALLRIDGPKPAQFENVLANP